MNQFYLFFFASLFFGSQLNAQYSHQDIFPTQTGATLLNNLNLNYKPGFLLSYNDARDTMFSVIYNENDTVACVYSGMKRYLSPFASDPTAVMYDNGSSISINTEHTYPQSKTSNEAGKRDLHHMFPTRERANSGRGSTPFGIIAASNVDKWYYDAQTLTTAPPSNILPLSSKQQNNVMFEPRDDYKGNIARAMFYYYTMYQFNADQVDPNFFNTQKVRLCQWHLEDPVDSLEWVRTDKIATWQSNRVNPFVKDCTLPQRCGYCTQVCVPPNAISRQEDMGLELFDNYPNPFDNQTVISYQLNREQSILLEIYNSLGQKIETLAAEEQSVGLHQYSVDASGWMSGIYFYKITLEYKNRSATIAKPLIVSKE